MADVRILTRPLERWPGEIRKESQRASSNFRASWTDTMELLVKEAGYLGAREVVLQLALSESEIRHDGWPYARAKTRHPGVIVSMETAKQGPLSFPCDKFRDESYHWILSGWKGNVRAVALAMGALRQVDRYGITSHGEQYVGWKALGSGIPMPAAKMTLEEAALILIDAAEDDGDDPFTLETILDPNGNDIQSLYRSAARSHHPDVGGDPDAFKLLTEARDLLLRFRG